MKQKSTFENFIKKELNTGEHLFNEALWNKLDQQLIPVREAYNKKSKRRVIAYWSILGVLLLGGVTTLWMASGEKTTKINANENTSKINEQPINENGKESLTNSLPTNANTEQVLQNSVASTELEKEATKISSLNTNLTTSINDDRVNSNINNLGIKRATTKRSSKKQPTSNEYTTNVKDSEALSVGTEKVDESGTKLETSPKEVTKPTIETTKPAIETTPKVEAKPTKEKEVAKTKKNITTSLPLEWYITGGVNFSSPFNKGGYYGGLLIEKQINEKRIFAGLKIAYNNLNHQLVASKNATTFPQTTDAVLNKMTTIQVPFGYQFKLSKGSISKATLLNVGFEPTLITGVQTIYYDDNGVPGGPRVPVINSPLLSNAINKFNVSFIAGVKKPITSKLALSLNAGYGLIDITDKQYYNKTSSNNNLKYIQAGVLLRLK